MSGLNEVVVERQYLRVKRRRTEAPPSVLRLEGLHLQARGSSRSGKATATITSLSALSSLSLATTQLPYEVETLPSENVSRKRSTTALLRRVTQVVSNDYDVSSAACSYRVVDAVLAADECEEDELEAIGKNKRRRLTLVETKTVADTNALERLLNPVLHKPQTKKKRVPIRVLNPVERRVDESLKQVYQGEITPRQHFDFVSNNESLLQRRFHWLAWNNTEMGTLLHACALWNDAELTVDLLQLVGPKVLGSVLDGDGQTPYQVAETTRHTSVMEVLEAFGLDNSNYVYDLYCLDENNNDEKNHDGELQDQKVAFAEHDWSCELKGGYGYWDDQGRLMLEALDQSLLEHDLPDPEGDDDNDEDSNDEGYAGNDYPDENHVYWDNEDGNNSDNDDDDDDEEKNDNTFRSHKSPYDYAEEDHDAAYGIYGQE